MKALLDGLGYSAQEEEKQAAELRPAAEAKPVVAGAGREVKEGDLANDPMILDVCRQLSVNYM